MRWIAPPAKDPTTGTPNKRLSESAGVLSANRGLCGRHRNSELSEVDEWVRSDAQGR